MLKMYSWGNQDRMSIVSNSTQLVREKSETEINNPSIATPAITTTVDPRSSSKLGQEAFPSSERVSL
jgi:hypothetical protein